MERPPERNPEEGRRDRLRGDFRNIFSAYALDIAKIDELFDQTAKSYSANERAYHTLEHIEHFLTFLKARREKIQDWTAVQLATWLHDVIYDTSLRDNEKQSARYARQHLDHLGVPEKLIARTEALIRATATHASIEGDSDSEIFLDGDLAILGSPEDVYDRYADNIRKEYSHVPDDLYRAGRTRVLETFLTRPRIYTSDSAYTQLETQARKNIRREIERLK